MLWLVPRLFPDPRLLDVAVRNLRLPGLQALLGRGIPQQEPAIGIEAALCRACGIACQQDWPLAPILYEAEGGAPGEDYWLRADPVHLALMRDRIVLAVPSLDLDPDEAGALADALTRHFGNALDLDTPHPERWYLRLPRPPRLVTTGPSLAVGRAIDGVLPQGEDAAAWRATLNEAQMLLHAHPVNLAREARGVPVANSLWLWGGGVRPEISLTPPTLYAAGDVPQAIARYCAAPLHTLPDKLSAVPRSASSVLLLDTLDAPASLGDALGWRDALRELEKRWFAPLANSLRRTSMPEIRILDPVSGRSLRLRRSDTWRFWRRPSDLAAGLKPL